MLPGRHPHAYPFGSAVHDDGNKLNNVMVTTLRRRRRAPQEEEPRGRDRLMFLKGCRGRLLVPSGEKGFLFVCLVVKKPKHHEHMNRSHQD